MANIKSSQKSIKTDEKRRVKNASFKSSIRTAAKKVEKVLKDQAGDINEANKAYKILVKRLDTASRKNIVHWKTAARKKSRVAKRVNALAAKKTAQA